MLKKLWLCLLVALLARLTFLFAALPVLEERFKFPYRAQGFDADGYGVIANRMLIGKFDDIERAPLYPAFVAVIFAVCFHSVAAVQVAQALVDAATVWLIWRIGSQHSPQRSFGVVAGWLYAIYPLAWWRCVFVNKEILETFVLALFVWLFFAAVQSSSSSVSRGLRPFLYSGLALGAANLVKPIFLLWPLPLAIWFWMERKKMPRVGGVWLALLAGMVLLTAPWTVRNYIMAGVFVPVATERAGVTMFIGNYYPTRGAWESGKEKWKAELKKIDDAHPNASAVERDRIYFRAALASLAASPLQCAEMLARKAWRFWFSNASGRLGQLVLVTQILFVGLGIFGAIRRGLDSSSTAFFFLLIGYVWLLHAVIYADVRFSLPLMPYVMLLGAAALATRANVQETV